MPKKEILKKNLINITEGSVSYKRALNRAEKALKQLDAISAGQTIRGKKGEDVVINKEYDKKILDALRHIEDVKRMITDESIEQAVDEKKKKEEEVVTASNEQSEGHGKMPSEVIPESVVSISEETLKNVIKRVIQERSIKAEGTIGEFSTSLAVELTDGSKGNITYDELDRLATTQGYKK